MLDKLIAELQLVGDKAPQVLSSLKVILDKVAAGPLPPEAVAFLNKFFPSLVSLEATVVADAKMVVDFLLVWEPAVLPHVIQALRLLDSILSMFK